MCIPLAAPEGERYIIGKLSLINNASPRSEMGGTIRTDDEIFTFYHFHQPKESVAQWISRVPSSFQDVKFYFRSARHLSHNLYNMVPDFVGFLWIRKSRRFPVIALYNYSKKKHSFLVELFDFHHVWKAQYAGSHPLDQSLWKNESLAFLSYNYAFTPNVATVKRECVWGGGLASRQRKTQQAVAACRSQLPVSAEK